MFIEQFIKLGQYSIPAICCPPTTGVFAGAQGGRHHRGYGRRPSNSYFSLRDLLLSRRNGDANPGSSRGEGTRGRVFRFASLHMVAIAPR